MQKNYSQTEKYVRGIHRNVRENLVTGAIIILVMMIIHLVSGCGPILPNEQKTLSDEVDSVPENKEMSQEQEINDWDTDTTVYHTTTQPN